MAQHPWSAAAHNGAFRGCCFRGCAGRLTGGRRLHWSVSHWPTRQDRSIKPLVGSSPRPYYLALFKYHILTLWGNQNHVFASSFSRFAHTMQYLNPSGFKDYFNPFRMLSITVVVLIVATALLLYLSGIPAFESVATADSQSSIINLLVLSFALYIVSQFVVPPESSIEQKLGKARRRVFLWAAITVVTVWYSLGRLGSSTGLLELGYLFGVVIIALDRLGSTYADFSRRVEEHDPLTRVSRSWRSPKIEIHVVSPVCPREQPPVSLRAIMCLRRWFRTAARW